MSQPRPIPMREPISFEDRKAGVAERRRISEAASPGPARREEGAADDRRLRAPPGEDLASGQAA